MTIKRRGRHAVAGLVFALVSSITTFGVLLAGPSGAAATVPSPPPYFPDAGATTTMGGIDFFNAAGVQITTGSTTTSPFAGFAVAQNAPAAGTKATAFIYTPLNGSPPGSWGGAQVTGATTYPISAPASLSALTNPIVTGGSGDTDVADYISTHPNNDVSTTDGYAGMYAVRIKVSGQLGYASADIFVSGTTWTQVDGSYTSPAHGGGSGPVTTTTAIAANQASPVSAGTSVTFTATLTPSSAVGAVQFMDGTSTLGSPVTVSAGTATSVATTTLPAGTHSITAVFTPADATAFVTSTSSAISFVVNSGGGSGPVTTTTAVAANQASPVSAGTSVTFTATLTPGSAVGAVQFMDGTTALGSAVPVSAGSATSVAATTLPAGTHSITAVFTPTDATVFVTSTSSAISFVVNAAGATPTTTALAVSPASPTTAGISVTFTATVSPSSVVGSVQFLVGTTHLGNAVPVSSGSAVLATTALPQGTDSITAVFTPTDATAFTTSTSSALSYVVNQSLTALTTTTALAVSPATTAATGTVVQLTATVTCAATCTPVGSVTFWDGGSVQIGSAVALASGSASVSSSTLSIGSTHSFIAKFAPTDATAFGTSQSAAVPYNITSTDSGTATVTSSAGADLGTNPNLTPGQSVTVVAGGFTAGETVTATVHSVPQTLTPTTASTTGTISYVLVVPADLPAGAHSLVLAGATSSHTVTINFTIGSTSAVTDPAPTVAGVASLPFTGANVELMSVIALLCICAGFVIRFRGHESQRVGAHARTGPRHAR